MSSLVEPMAMLGNAKSKFKVVSKKFMVDLKGQIGHCIPHGGDKRMAIKFAHLTDTALLFKELPSDEGVVGSHAELGFTGRSAEQGACSLKYCLQHTQAE